MGPIDSNWPKHVQTGSSLITLPYLLVERWVRGCAAQIGCFFGLSGLPMAPFLFENWFRNRSRFCEIHDYTKYMSFYFSLPIGCQKSTHACQFTW